MKISQHCRLCVCAGLLCGVVSVAKARESATDEDRYLYLRSQSLEAGLQAVSEQFNQPFITNGVPQAENIITQEMQGWYSLDEALASLLKNTGLIYSINSSGIVISEGVTDLKQAVIEEISVSGIRGSLNLSRQAKRHNNTITDVIAAQEIASYPDRNIAESLQRIPGIAITREAGEGRQIILRGLNPDFTLVTLNGMPVLANNDSPMDSRLQRHRDRSFDLNLFTTDLFNEIEVYKSYSAHMPSGGLAGTASLKTAHPFDTPGMQWTVSQQLGANQYADGIATRTSGMVSSTRGNWGALFLASYGERNSQELGANTFRWRQLPPAGADISLLDEQVADDWRNEKIWVPRGNRYSLWQSDMQRLGIGASIEYLSDKNHLTLDWIYGRLDATRTENHVYPRGLNSTPVIDGKTQITEAIVDNANTLSFARYNNARVGTENRFQDVSTRFRQWVVNSENTFTNTIKGRGVIGFQKSSYAMPDSIKAYMRGATDIIVDYRSADNLADINYADDLTSPFFWTMNELDSERYFSELDFYNAKYTFDIQSSATASWTLGMDLIHFQSISDYVDIQNMLLEQWQDNQTSTQYSNEVPVSASTVLTAHPKLAWLTLDPHDVFSAYRVPTTPDALRYTNLTDPNTWLKSQDEVTETRAALFLQKTWEKNNWYTEAGVRIEHGQTAVTSFANTDSTEQNWADINILPALNINYRVADNVYRLSASRTLGRPQLDILSAPVTYDDVSNTLLTTNPELTSYSSYNLDLAYEKYPGDTNRFSVTTYAKWLDNFIVSTGTITAFSDLTQQEQALITHADSTSRINKVMPVNAEQSLLYGIEGSVEYEFPLTNFFSPAMAYHLGVVADASYSQGKLNYYNDQTGAPLEKKRLPYLSPWLANLTVYLESYALSVRLSATYRDEYIARVDSNTLQDEDETGFEQSLYIDAVLAYQFTDNWELRLEATNLTDEAEEQYSDSSHRPYNTTVSGRNYYVSLSYRY